MSSLKCNCSRSAAIQEYPAAIGDAWLQLQNTRLQSELLGCNCGLRIRHAGSPPKGVCRYTEARAANPGKPDVLFTPLKCNLWLKLQVVVLRSRGCKRHVCTGLIYTGASRDQLSAVLGSCPQQQQQLHTTTSRSHSAHQHGVSRPRRAVPSARPPQRPLQGRLRG